MTVPMQVSTGLTGQSEDETLRDALGYLGSQRADRLQSMTLSLERRDPYTAEHQRRVGLLAGALARELGLSETDSQGVALAGALHDIGKSFVPARILGKQGRLNEFELYVVKGHPRAGHSVLKAIDFPWPVARIALEHHERLDGSGYPAGLRGDEIDRQSRIVAVADVMEAITSLRPYRQPLTLAESIDHLTLSRGILYDPEVVDACIWLFTVKGYRFP